jgi:hypothetical protein
VEEKENRWFLLAKDAAFDGLREEARRENEASGVEDGGGTRRRILRTMTNFASKIEAYSVIPDCLLVTIKSSSSSLIIPHRRWCATITRRHGAIAFASKFELDDESNFYFSVSGQHGCSREVEENIWQRLD